MGVVASLLTLNLRTATESQGLVVGRDYVGSLADNWKPIFHVSEEREIL